MRAPKYAIMFSDLCNNLNITVQDGLKLFTKSTHINHKFTYNIPFIGSGLHKHPYNFFPGGIFPENIYCSNTTAWEITKRLKTLNPYLLTVLRQRYQQANDKIAPRKELRMYQGMESKFYGLVSAIRISDNKHYCNTCIEDLRFIDSTDTAILADHTWVGFPIIAQKHIEVGNYIYFKGKIVEYLRNNKFIYKKFMDVHIKPLKLYINVS